VENAYFLFKKCKRWLPTKEKKNKTKQNFISNASSIVVTGNHRKEEKLKINIDGAYLEGTSEEAIAAVCRDNHGCLVDSLRGQLELHRRQWLR